MHPSKHTRKTFQQLPIPMTPMRYAESLNGGGSGVVPSLGSVADESVPGCYLDSHKLARAETKPPWIAPDEPAAKYFGEPQYLKKNKALEAVQDWLWESRPEKTDKPPEEEFPSLPRPTPSNGKPVFDLSHGRDLLNAQKAMPPGVERQTTPFPPSWTYAARPAVSRLDGIWTNTREDALLLSKQDQNFKIKETEPNNCSAFNDFVRQIQAMQRSTINGGQPNSDANNVEAFSSYLAESQLLARSQECEISARSTRTFWLEKLAAYHHQLGRIHEERVLKANFFADLKRAECERAFESTDSSSSNEEISDKKSSSSSDDEVQILDEDHLSSGKTNFDRAFLSVVDEELMAELKLLSDLQDSDPSVIVEHVKDKTSGYESREVDSELLRLALSQKTETRGRRRRRCTSTPVQSLSPAELAPPAWVTERGPSPLLSEIVEVSSIPEMTEAPDKLGGVADNGETYYGSFDERYRYSARFSTNLLGTDL